MTVSIQWKPDKSLRDRLKALAKQRGESPEKLISEAVRQYLDVEYIEYSEGKQDPLVGLFAGSEHLAYQSEEILQREIREQSGWTWKANSS